MSHKKKGQEGQFRAKEEVVKA